MIENWRDVVGYEGHYQVSDLGRVRSLKYGEPRLMVGAVRTNRKQKYWAVTLLRDRKQKTKCVHQLVLLAFVGPCPEGMEGLHRNGDSLDNRLSNLKWGTHQENMAMRTYPKGSQHPNAKLTEEGVRQIRARAAAGESQRKLARAFGVDQRAIWGAIHGWKHVTEAAVPVG